MEYANQQRNKLLEEHKWIHGEKDFFGLKDHKYDFDNTKIGKQREERNKLYEENEDLKKRINLKVDVMFEKTE